MNGKVQCWILFLLLVTVIRGVAGSPWQATASVTQAFRAIESDSLSQCDAFNQLGDRSIQSQEWALAEWAAKKGANACASPIASQKIALYAALQLNQADQAYGYWSELSHSENGLLHDTGHHWQFAVSHALAETPWMPYAPDSLRVPAGPYNVGRAERLSLVPGLGQAYLGQWGFAAHYVIVNALFASIVAWRSYDAFTTHNRDTRWSASLDATVVAALIWPRYYLGSAREARREAQSRNRNWHRERMLEQLRAIGNR
jgi:hypothetical protein